MDKLSRRDFTRDAISSVLTFSLLETLFENDAFADEVKPLTGKWLAEVNQVARELKDETIKQVIWQEKVEELLSEVPLEELLKLVNFERLTKNLKIKSKSETSLRFNFNKVEGAPARLAFGKQIFALNKGNSVVPHGHNNMVTAFLILKGDLHGRHFDRLKDEPKHLIIKPTIDRKFKPGECSTISDYKDNIHWFEALTDDSFIFNIHVFGLKRPGPKLPTSRVYVDPEGEKLKGGLIRAPRSNFKELTRKYG